ncbi:MAG: class I SAM-dependent methyltransferase [Zetaproteobacteria bacterium]|nr:MAG: class I SAM-dependent methyltransferase [Zetaproteobacteria bacterium]
MAYVDFMSALHKRTRRDYLARVTDPDFPKAKAARLAKQWGYDYWDGDRRICYGGYRYIPGRWTPVARAMIDHYSLRDGDRVLDVGCGKGFLLYEIQRLLPGIRIAGIDISSYAIEHAKAEVRPFLQVAHAGSLPFADRSFDLVYSINTLHNLHNYDLDRALRELERVGKRKYLCVESYRTEEEKANLLYWQVTCEAFCTPEEWEWWFRQSGYSGDYSFIFFE